MMELAREVEARLRDEAAQAGREIHTFQRVSGKLGSQLTMSAIEAADLIASLSAENERLQRNFAEADRVIRQTGTALKAIADEPEVHTKLNQERLCCKFQHIAAEALEAARAFLENSNVKA